MARVKAGWCYGVFHVDKYYVVDKNKSGYYTDNLKSCKAFKGWTNSKRQPLAPKELMFWE